MSEQICIPDIGGAEGVTVIELLVSAGDRVAVDTPLLTLEGDKATMEIPSPVAGLIESLTVQVGDTVSQGSVVATAQLDDAAQPLKTEKPADSAPETVAPVEAKSLESKHQPESSAQAAATGIMPSVASPGVRRLARECEVDLSSITGTGPKGRILRADVVAYVKRAMASGGAKGVGFDWPPLPKMTEGQWGPTTVEPLSKIKRLSGANLHRNWVTIPHVTQHDEADITELEAFRQRSKADAQSRGLRLTPLVFIMKAVVAALKDYPRFNAQLSEQGDALILKQYYHIGVAVDTPNGLVVPVVRDVDQKSLYQLAAELAELSEQARQSRLGIAKMQGGCFTVSSLGGIGGTAFTPIINAPEVGILGVARSQSKPQLTQAGDWMNRLMLPLSLSYDHRVIDGAEGARFLVAVANYLSDIRRIMCVI